MVSYLLLFVGIANIAFIILCVVYIKQMNKAKSRPSQDNNHHALPQNNKRKNDWQNRRKDFRVGFDGKPCMAEFIEFESSQLSNLTHKRFEGTIENISGGGIKIVCPYNLPIRDRIIIQVEFEIKETPFTLEGEIVRKEEYKQKDIVAYGVKFHIISESMKQDLIRSLNQIVLERRQKSIS